MPTAYARSVGSLIELRCHVISFSREFLDPYYVDPGITPSLLDSPTYPSQSLVYGQSGFLDGIKVDADLYTVFITGYLKYAVPDDMVAAATPTVVPPSPNQNESMSCNVSSSVLSVR